MGIKANSPMEIWSSFTAEERRRIAVRCGLLVGADHAQVYVAGIMAYKFGLEMWNGAVVTCASPCLGLD